MTERTYKLIDNERRDNCARYVASLPTGTKPPLEVLIRPYRKRRSSDQNSRYWWMLTLIAQEAHRSGLSCDPETGESVYRDPETFHEYFKRRFLGKRVVIDGDIELLPESSARQTVMEFADYMTQVEAWAAEHGIVIPNEDAA